MKFEKCQFEIMKRSLSELKGYRLQELDGSKAWVKDFLFDQKRWVIRYIEADWGGLFSGKKVLIPRILLGKPDWTTRQFPVRMKLEELEQCPKLEEHLPISLSYEKELNKHFKTAYYWSDISMSPLIDPSLILPPGPLVNPLEHVDENNMDTQLRSFNEIVGYHIQSEDEKIGHIADLIINDENWQIIYLVIDTSNWLPWSKKVLISTEWIHSISYVDELIHIHLDSESIRTAPTYEPNQAINREYEIQLYDYFGRPIPKF